MNHSTTQLIGLDISKTTFHVVGLSDSKKVTVKKKLSRGKLLQWFAQHPVCTVSMEACGSAHYWSRELGRLGFCVKLIPPQHVKAFVRTNKNDFNDALAIAEATDRPGLHYVETKTPAQQDQQALHRIRDIAVKQRVAIGNQIRGLLSEYGIVMPTGVATLRKSLPLILEDAENGLSAVFRSLIQRKYQQLVQLDEEIEFYNDTLKKEAEKTPAIKQLQTIPGFGPIVASAFYMVFGCCDHFKRGRDVSAALGLVPRQHSTGGKDRLLGISKRGDKHLRKHLVHGARAVLSRADKKTDPLSLWVLRLSERRGKNKATVALANKLARIAWAVLKQDTEYQVGYISTP